MEKFILCLLIAGGVYWYTNHANEDEDYLPENAPAGALEYFESKDGKVSMTLFEDRLLMKGIRTLNDDAVFEPGELAIPIATIGSVRKLGSDFKIIARDGTMMKFNLGFLNRTAASRFAETLDELLEEQNSSHRSNL